MALLCFEGDGIDEGKECTLQAADGNVKIAGLPVAVAPIVPLTHQHGATAEPCGPSETINSVTVNGRNLVELGTAAGCSRSTHVYERSVSNAAAIASSPIALRVQVN
jgi:uncharacterized Zn-binding protein involved in type VI secretion